MDAAAVLAEVVAAGRENGLLDRVAFLIRAAFGKSPDRFRPSADEQELAQKAHQFRMESLRNRLAQGILAEPVAELIPPHPQHEFLELHRAEVQVFDAADRHGEPMVLQHDLQERARGHHVKVRHVLVKIPQRREDLGRGLDFIQKQKRASGPQRGIEPSLKQWDNRSWRLRREERGRARLSLEVDLQQVIEVRLGKRSHEEGFPDLMRPAYDDGLARRSRLPFTQVVECESVYGRPPWWWTRDGSENVSPVLERANRAIAG